MPTCDLEKRVYRPRRAQDSPLYKIVLDEIESLVLQTDESDERPAANVENSLRAFLECGIHRFGVVRFGCKKCKTDLFVPFSCKRRLSCPSCDAKRAVAETSIAMETLLPNVPYRQWVLVIPKRLRYFVHCKPALANELSRILATTLARYYEQKAPIGAGKTAPIQMHVIQRFGSTINLHEHVHSALSDGVFGIVGDRLRFYPATAPTQEELMALSRELRRRIVKRMLRLGAIPEETGREILARKHGGFSLNGQVRVEAGDRAGLERLLRYFLRPALTLERLSYDPELESVRYRPKKGAPGFAPVLQWKPLEFLKRFARLIPPPWLHLVRYHGALAPNSPLRQAVTWAAREKIPYSELVEGVPISGLAGVTAKARRECQKVLSAACRAWAACLRRVFEINPLVCPSCGVEMKPLAVIMEDRELKRLLTHLGLPTEYDRTKPARSPPLQDRDRGLESQIDPAADAFDGRDDQPADWMQPRRPARDFLLHSKPSRPPSLAQRPRSRGRLPWRERKAGGILVHNRPARI